MQTGQHADRLSATGPPTLFLSAEPIWQGLEPTHAGKAIGQFRCPRLFQQFTPATATARKGKMNVILYQQKKNNNI